ncbi:MAG TPA: hypothetical protein VI542_16165 [Candidatus Tectomicrobia bacterium]
MLTRFLCPYVQTEVELTEERERHIAERHPDLLLEHRTRIADTLADPGQVRRSTRLRHARLFTRWFDTMRGGKHVVVVVVTDVAASRRHWVVTAYMARKLTEGDIEWTKS